MRKTLMRQNWCGVVVQLVRIPACHAGGRGFESRPLRHYLETLAEKLGFLRLNPLHFLFIRIACASWGRYPRRQNMASGGEDEILGVDKKIQKSALRRF